ncbi:ABC transporter permease [Tessaracoccus sp. MC1756]|uniref:ABC transporter permease n=1 Tax=Tessaracoccus sp. MC1756 TaxID=2760311 RepID=UPI00160040A2|nr:ABC transporter permease [Tessaracoccus sp. MC1756]MBB1508271.1 ABC transporter permease [Tessaracoccus sp. MC1756]
MFLAIRELVFAKGRFILMGSVVSLIAILMVLLSGLSSGLVNDGVSGLMKLPVTSLAFQEDVSTDSAFTRSVVEKDTVGVWADQDGVAEAAPLGSSLVNGESESGVEIDLALFGVEPGSFVDPEVVDGERLTGGPGEIVISETAAESGIGIGDVIVLEMTETQLTVVGIMDGQHTFGHVDMAFTTLESWQEIRAGIREGEEVHPHVYDYVTAVAVNAEDGSALADADFAAGDRAAETTSLTLHESFGASPGYTAETLTLQMIQIFLYGISALVVGAFFTVLTIQRTQEIAVLRAMGAGTRYLLRDALAQSLLLLVGAVAVGVGIGLALGAWLSSTPMPFVLELSPIVLAAVLLLVLGMVGAVVAVLRISRVDPLTALGGAK